MSSTDRTFQEDFAHLPEWAKTALGLHVCEICDRVVMSPMLPAEKHLLRRQILNALLVGQREADAMKQLLARLDGKG